MKQRHTSRSGLFLMELMIAIFFFAIVSSVCIQLFVKAYLINEDSSQQTKASLECQNIIEIWQSNDLEYYLVDLPYHKNIQSNLTLYYDESWQIITEDPTYTLEATYDQKHMHIKVFNTKKLLYEIETKKYEPERRTS